LRFNDLTQTILAIEERTGLAAATLWRQCVDMLAQHDQPGKVMLRQEDRVALVARLNDLRSELSEAQRIASVVELGSRLRSPALVEFFASDRPAVCAAAMARARLPDMIWPVLLPRLGPTARGVLRGRRDIGPETKRALEAFGKTDLVLGQSRPLASNDLEELSLTDFPIEEEAPFTKVVPAEATEKNEERGAVVARLDTVLTNASLPADDGERSQIRQLVERIERFTSTSRDRGLQRVAEGVGVAEMPEIDPASTRHFPFETDADGMFVWVGDASRTALVGLSIAQPAMPGETGPDGHVAGAFARRSSFQHGRLFIEEGLYAGEWRLSAVPFFDPGTGRFQGFRGQARRPLVHEVPHQVPPPVSAVPNPPSLDSMRQIIHELRTPLNAIQGFAEIIEQQLFGPVGVHYREIAGNILADARRLLAAFEDIDLAARSAAVADATAPRPRADAVDVEHLMEQVSELYNSDHGPVQGVATGHRPRLRVTSSVDIPPALIEPVQGERMIQHLVRTLISVAGDHETVQSALWFQPNGRGGRLVIGFDRPERLKGLEEKEILDPGYGRDGDWPDAPLLGLGFSMRLIRSLAQGLGGVLRIENERILLELPVADVVAGNEAG